MWSGQNPDGGENYADTVSELAEPGRGAPSLLLLDLASLGVGMLDLVLVVLVLAARTLLNPGCEADSVNVFVDARPVA